MYGRDEEDWDQLADAGLAFLIERARLEKLTSYTELNATLQRRTGLPGFDFRRACSDGPLAVSDRRAKSPYNQVDDLSARYLPGRQRRGHRLLRICPGSRRTSAECLSADENGVLGRTGTEAIPALFATFCARFILRSMWAGTDEGHR